MAPSCPVSGINSLIGRRTRRNDPLFFEVQKRERQLTWKSAWNWFA